MMVYAIFNSRNELYKEYADQHKRFKGFAMGNHVQAYLRKEWVLKGSSFKFRSRKVGACKIGKKITSSAYIDHSWFIICPSNKAYI